MRKFQVHQSGLALLSKCGEAFKRRYIEGDRRRPNAAGIIGTGTDRSVMANLDRKIETGALMPQEEAIEKARDGVVIEWEASGNEVVLSGEEWSGMSQRRAKEKAIDAAVRLAGLHYVLIAPNLQPTATQKKFVLDIEGSDIQLAGAIDIEENSGDCIRDLKTSAKSPGQDEADISMQLTMYAMARRTERVSAGLEPMPEGGQKVALDYMVNLKRTPKAMTLESVRRDQDFFPLLHRIETAQRIIQSGMFTPAPNEAWWCSQDWCGYFDSCRYARRPISVAVKGAAQ